MEKNADIFQSSWKTGEAIANVFVIINFLGQEIGIYVRKKKQKMRLKNNKEINSKNKSLFVP